MITVEQATAIALQRLNNPEPEDKDPDNPNYDPGEIAITKIMSRPYGWIFLYQTKEFIDTGNGVAALFGSIPLIVEKTGENDYMYLPIPMKNPGLSDELLYFDIIYMIRVYDYCRIVLGKSNHNVPDVENMTIPDNFSGD
ncbi:MAG: YrhB domain-containing protein [Chloroflexota bacterium]